MNETCPVCGVRFEREPGYFLGAMYVSYALAVPILAGLTLLSWWALPAATEPIWALVAALAVFLLFVPAVFRYSRVVWMHLDRVLHPERGDEP